MSDETDTGGLINVSPLYPNEDILRVFGEVAFLAFYSDLYGHWSARSIARSFEPPIYLKQFNVYRAKNVPRGIVTWALMNDAAEDKHVNGAGLNSFEDWQSGEQLWIMDIMAPWNHGRDMIEDIKTTVQTNSVKTLRIHNGVKKILEWHREDADSKWKIRSTRIA